MIYNNNNNNNNKNTDKESLHFSPLTKKKTRNYWQLICKKNDLKVRHHAFFFLCWFLKNQLGISTS